MKVYIYIISIFILIYGCNSTKKNNNNVDKKVSEKMTIDKYTTRHIFKALYEGIEYRECMGRTSRCPRCESSGEFGKFKVIEYLTHYGKGQSGQEKLGQYQIRISDYDKNDINSPHKMLIINLNSGDQVEMGIDIVYDTRKSSVKRVDNIRYIKEI